MFIKEISDAFAISSYNGIVYGVEIAQQKEGSYLGHEWPIRFKPEYAVTGGPFNEGVTTYADCKANILEGKLLGSCVYENESPIFTCQYGPLGESSCPDIDTSCAFVYEIVDED